MKSPSVLKRAITAIALDRHIFVQNAFKRNIIFNSTGNSTGWSINEIRMFPKTAIFLSLLL